MVNEDEWWDRKCDRGLHGCGRLQRLTKQANFFLGQRESLMKKLYGLVSGLHPLQLRQL